MADLDPGYDFPVLPAGDATHPGKIVPRGFLQLIDRESRWIPGLWQRPARDRRPDRQPGESIDRACDGEPHLALSCLAAASSPPRTISALTANVRRIPNCSITWRRVSCSEGWSIKKQIRFLVLSQTFRQSSRPAAESLTADPQNRLLSHYPVHRLEGESIRDSILRVSGRLDPALYGPSVQPHREEPKEYRKLYPGPLDGNGRRSIYIKVTRHEGSRFLETFDFPNPTVARGNRDTTNVPTQALALLNDPFVLEQAGVWADRLIAEAAPDCRNAARFHVPRSAGAVAGWRGARAFQRADQGAGQSAQDACGQSNGKP